MNLVIKDTVIGNRVRVEFDYKGFHLLADDTGWVAWYKDWQLSYSTRDWACDTKWTLPRAFHTAGAICGYSMGRLVLYKEL